MGRVLGPGSLGPRPWEPGPRPWEPGPGPWELGPGPWELGPGASWCPLAEAGMPAAAPTYYAGITFIQHLIYCLFLVGT